MSNTYFRQTMSIQSFMLYIFFMFQNKLGKYEAIYGQRTENHSFYHNIKNEILPITSFNYK